MRIARRYFLGLIGAGAAVLTAPLVLRSEIDLVTEVLRKRIPGLRMDQAEMEQFATDFLADYKSNKARRRNTILVGARIVESMPEGLAMAVLPGRITSPLQALERRLFRAFFLGTDFLEVESDPTLQVTYLYIPDPYEVGCSNLLAQYDI